MIDDKRAERDDRLRSDPPPDDMAILRSLICWFLGLAVVVCAAYSAIESLRMRLKP